MNLLIRLLIAGSFYIVFTPMGALLRACKIDLTDKDIDSDANTYWLETSDHIPIKRGYKK